jgi:hypothetical protein
MKSNSAAPHAIVNPHALAGGEVVEKLESTLEGLRAGEVA